MKGMLGLGLGLLQSPPGAPPGTCWISAHATATSFGLIGVHVPKSFWCAFLF